MIKEVDRGLGRWRTSKGAVKPLYIKANNLSECFYWSYVRLFEIWETVILQKKNISKPR